MSSPVHDLAAWGPSRWLLVVLLGFVGHLTLVLWLSDYQITIPPHSRPPMPARLVLFDPAAPRTDEADPTLFALTTPHGFSRSAWLSVSRFDYRPTNALPEPEWLTMAPEELTQDLVSLVLASSTPDETWSAKLSPALTRIPVSRPVIIAATQVEAVGSLAARPLQSGQPFPLQPEPLLTNTVVRVVVDEDGATLSAVLLSSSLVTKADGDALAFARQARFSPAHPTGSPPKRSGLTFGNLVFKWYQVVWNEDLPTTAAR